MSYCEFSAKEGERSLHKRYHDTTYGFPIHDDDELFGRLILEINQAGLSWTTILKKEAGFRAAYDEFSIAKIANYGDREVAKLLADPGIIRNRLKITATIYNAQVIQLIQDEHGSFKTWLDQHHPRTKKEWVKLFRQSFKFTGGEIVNEFLVSTGYLPGAHEENCPIARKVLQAKPAWNCKNQS